jgi:hypothetical protein
MAEWRLRVFGSEPSVLTLSECLQPSAWWRLTHEAGEWYLVRNETAEAGNGAVFADEAGLIVDRTNTVCKFRSPSHEPLSLAHPMLLKDDGTRQYFVRVSIPVPMEIGHSVKLRRFGSQIVDVIWARSNSPSDPSFDYRRAYERLMADPKAERVIKSFLDRSRDWCQIYNLIELIEHRCGGKIPATWVSGKRLKRLKGTACSWPEAGRTGRHADPNIRGPSRPIRIEEGEQIAKHILGCWLQQPGDRPYAAVLARKRRRNVAKSNGPYSSEIPILTGL